MRNSDKFKFTLSVFAGALICLTAFSVLLLSAQRVSADTTANVNVSIDIPAHCSLTVNPDNQSTTVDPGNTATLTTQVKAVCNDPAGLAVYSVGYTNETYGNNNFVGEINNNTYLIRSNNIANPTTSQWNMKIEPVNGDYIPTVDNSFNTAQIVPTQYTKVAHRDTATDMGNNAVGAKFNAIFSIFVDHTQIAGTYTAKVKFLLLHPHILAYNDQTGQPDTVTPGTLYSMQNVQTWSSSVNSGETVTAIDERDNELYTVARLADGNLWMTKNLRLNIETANITAQNTDNPSEDFLTAISSKPAPEDNWCNNSADPTCVNHIYYNTSNLGDNTIDSENHTYDEHGVYYNWYTATAGNGTSSTAANATVTGSICPYGWHLPSGTVTNVGAPADWGGEYWKLAAGLASVDPNNVQNSDYSAITSSENRSRFLISPNNFRHSGLYAVSSVSDRGSVGYYWTTTTASSIGNANTLLLGSNSYFSPGYSANPKNLGESVRCIANPYPYYLQDIATWRSYVGLGNVVEAIDRRDGQIYKVKRLKMNAAGTETALWMSNLNLGAQPLTAAQLDDTNTNLASGVSAIPTTTFNSWIRSSSDSTYAEPVLIPITTSNSGNGQTQDSYGNKYGTLYNYAAASAGTYTLSTGTGNATSDLCPAGWRMPIGGVSGDTAALYDAYPFGDFTDFAQTSTFLQEELGFSLAGSFFAPSAPYRQGIRGYYWSSTFYDYIRMYGLYFGEGDFLPNYYATNTRQDGYSMRCIENQ